MNLTKDHAGVAPVIDIAPFFRGSPAAQAAVAQSLGAACEHTGFFLITGHGIERNVIDEAVSACRTFFALPEPAKLRSRPGVTNGPGYRPIETVSLAATLGDAAPPDLKEGFLISPLLAYRNLPEAYVYSPASTKWFRENVWPEEVPRFQGAWTSYYRAMESLSATLMRIAALALDLPENSFEAAFNRHISQLTARNYPPLAHVPKPGQLRAGAHTDYGALTILWKDEGSGSLQVLDKGGAWRDIIPEPDCLVINIGDLLAQWTNDRWVSTLHRVALPGADEREAGPRLSIPFFYKPNYDAVIQTLESCIDDEHPLRYASVLAGEHMSMKRDKHIYEGS